MGPALAITLAAVAAAAVIVAHLLSRGQAPRMAVGSVRFIPPQASRQRRLGTLRDLLLLALRLALIGATLAWCLLLASDHPTAPPDRSRGAAISTLAGEPEEGVRTLASPALAAVRLGGPPEALTMADDARDGVTVAPDVLPGAWALKATVREPRTVAVLHAPSHALDALHVEAALEALAPERGLLPVASGQAGACDQAARETVVASDLTLWLGPVGAEAPRGRVLLVVDGAGAPGSPAREAAARWRLPGRFHPDVDPTVGDPTFPEYVATLLEPLANGGSASVVPDRRAPEGRPELLAALIVLLLLAERALSEKRHRAGLA